MLKNRAFDLNNDIEFMGTSIDDSNRKNIFIILYSFYLRSYQSYINNRKRGINEAKKDHKYRGRKAVAVDTLLFLDNLGKVKRKEISPKQAARKLNISIDKYYRVKKELQK